MSGTYLGGSSIIHIRRSDVDMKRRQNHWRKRLSRQQREFDAELDVQIASREKLAALNAIKGKNRGK